MTPHEGKIKEGHNEKRKLERKMIMKTKLLKSITGYFLFVCALASLVATMTLGTPATARAAADGGRVCSVGMLKGLYLWTVNGYASIDPTLLPITVMSGRRFNGDGTSINDFSTVNVGGTVIDGTGEVATYTVAPDCTGTMSVPDGPSFNIYVGPGGKKLWFIQTKSDFGLGLGTAERVPE
jgi:hypothetical protein